MFNRVIDKLDNYNNMSWSINPVLWKNTGRTLSAKRKMGRPTQIWVIVHPTQFLWVIRHHKCTNTFLLLKNLQKTDDIYLWIKGRTWIFSHTCSEFMSEKLSLSTHHILFCHKKTITSGSAYILNLKRCIYGHQC